MTDIHCHILPAVDDGSKTWETTLEMCRLAHSDGIRHIVATPHANGQYQYDRGANSESIAQLRNKVPDIEFSLGCDFHVSIENMEDAARFPERYVINETPYLLIEFSDFQTPSQMTESVNRLHSAGFLTIISHPERNQIIEAYPDLPQLFFDMGAVLQITAGSICGDWGRKAKKTCETLLKKGLVSFIASDAHDPKLRKPVLSLARKAAEKIVGRTAAEILVSNNPNAVVSSHVPTQSQEY